jgi:hypothetical protein
VITTNTAWAAITDSTVHPAITPIRRMPIPRGSARSRTRNPARRPARMRTSVCAATPALVPIDSSSICACVSDSSRPVPPITRKASATAMTTRLLATGAHMGETNRSRAFRTAARVALTP